MPRKEIIRFRRKSGEADLDVSVHPLKPGTTFPDFAAFYSHFVQKGSVDSEEDVTLDGVRGRRIAFSGWRVDGTPTAGVQYILEHDSKGYFMLFLASGEVIEEACKEADTMIRKIRFER